MKHARKTVLVDFNTIPQQPSTSNETVTNAIKSLANASEFNRSYFGSSTISISQLNNELSGILARTDLDSDSKLKLYSQSLGRYLFLQRESTKPTSGNVIVQPTSSADWTTASSSGRTSPTVSEASSWKSAIVSEPGATSKVNTSKSSTIPRANTPKSPLTRIPKYKSNLPRVTPKSQILRQNRIDRRRPDYFVSWANRK